MDRLGRFERGLPSPSKRDFAFVQHALASMKPTSERTCVLTALGVLYRGGTEESIRIRLIEDNLLDAVIALPERMLHGTSMQSAILVFRAQKSDRNVLFIDAADHCQVRRRQSYLSHQDIEDLVELYRHRNATSTEAHLVTIDEIRENEYNLSIQRYILKPEDKEALDPVVLQKQYQSIMANLTDTGKRIQERLDDLGFGNNN